MEEQEYPGNSRNPRRRPTERASEEAEKDDLRSPVVSSGDVTRKKRSFGRRLKDTFFGGTTEGVGSYVFFDVMLPAAKDMIVDAGGEALHRAVYGESRPYSSRTRGRGLGSSPFGRVAYDTISTRSQASHREERQSLSRRARARFEFDEVIIPSRHLADEILDRMVMILEKYQVVTVADLYELIEETPSHLDDKWGWADLYGAKPVRVNGGYLLDLPQPIALD